MNEPAANQAAESETAVSTSTVSDLAHYGFMARLLHRLALGSDAIAATAFDLDRLLFKADREADDAGPPVFIAGLARAGTTLLMRLLHQTGQFRSLTYRDMPFVTAPNLWRRLSAGSRRKGVLAERAHGDGLQVDFDSPEALEEVFWRIHCRSQYLLSDRLVPMTAAADVVASFRQYLAQILTSAPASARYLSKNNNNILRLPALREAFPEAVILVPFRDPLAQAQSLWQQHQRFSALHREQPFARRYMGWLVHHEFGGDHRPFDWRETASDPPQPPPREFGVQSEAQPGAPSDQPEYWLQQWLNAYRYLLNQAADPTLNLVLVDYDRLCREPAAQWQALAALTGVAPSLPEGLVIQPESAAPSTELPFIPSGHPLSGPAVALHTQLMVRALR